LHWGQRNDHTRSEVERLYGDSLLNPGGNLGRWRQVLRDLTDHGRRTAFSSEFTRHRGLEVVVPHVQSLTRHPAVAEVGEPVTVSWSCTENPPGTIVTLAFISPGGVRQDRGEQPLDGTTTFMPTGPGSWRVDLVASLGSGPEQRSASKAAYVAVT
jgi:hypothetical protein